MLFLSKTEKYHKEDKKTQKIAYWSLMAGIFLVYWRFNTQFYGPIILPDEVGYLTKAAAIAGHSIDLANHWNAGYPLLISPLFKIFSNPFYVWKVLLILQALVWVFSFVLLFKILRELFPEKDYWEIYVAVVISSIYPSWISMSGYAFVTTFFVFVYMLAIYAMLKISFSNVFSIVPHILLVGFLYWIHPAGKVIIAVSFLVLGGYAWYYRKIKMIGIYILLASVLIIVYKFGLHHWLDQVMNVENFKSRIYYKTIGDVQNSALHLPFWTAWFLMFWGQISSIAISTFGLAIYAFIAIWNMLKKQFFNNKNMINATLIFIGLSFWGIAASGSLSLATPSVAHHVAHSYWNYERYLDMVLLPLLGMGFLVNWRLIYTKITLTMVLFSGVLIYGYTNGYTSLYGTNAGFDNLTDTQSFWPVAVLHTNNYLFTFGVGAYSIFLVYLIGKRKSIYIMLFFWTLGIIHQGSWHWLWLDGYGKTPVIYQNYTPVFPGMKAIKGHSSPSSLYALIVRNYPKGECIGFDPHWPHSSFNYKLERRHLYSYYLFAYDIKRMKPEQWMKECDGPYLTYRPKKLFKENDIKIIAKEKRSGLYMVVKKEDQDKISSKSIPSYPTDLEIFLDK